MATIGRSSPPNPRALTAEKVAGYGAEQRRLKAAAAGRRAAAVRPGATDVDDSTAKASPAPARRSKYLQ